MASEIIERDCGSTSEDVSPTEISAVSISGTSPNSVETKTDGGTSPALISKDEPEQRTFCLRSNRVYLKNLTPDERNAILQSMEEFNQLKEWMYNRTYDAKFLHKGTEPTTKEIHAKAMELLGHDISGYEVRSLFSAVSGLISSQKELIKTYKQDQAERLKNRYGKICRTKQELEDDWNLKEALKQFHKENRRYPTLVELAAVKLSDDKELKIPKRLRELYPLHEDRPEKGEPIPRDPKDFQRDAYLFECWLDQDIRRTRARLHSIEDKQKRDKEKDYSIPRRITFGSLRQYRSKDTKKMDEQERKLWKQVRDYRRTCHMQISGVHTSVYGNFMCRYNPDTSELNLDLQTDKKRTLCLKNVVFPYRGNLLKDNFHQDPCRRQSVGYVIDLNYDHYNRPYLIIKAAVTLDRLPIPINTSNGVVAIDINWDHIAVDVLNKDGCSYSDGTVPLPLEGKTSNQNKDMIGRAAAEIIGLCEMTGKPLAMEDLDFAKKKAGMEYGSRARNRKLSLLAYDALTTAIINRAEDKGVAVILVDPAYTSFIGKVKYMKHRKVPVHIAAAHVIGRRAMGFTERIPAYLWKAKGRSKDSLKAWGRLYKVTKKMYEPQHFTHKLPIFKNQKDLKTFVEEQVG